MPLHHNTPFWENEGTVLETRGIPALGKVDMPTKPRQPITEILAAIEQGDSLAHEELWAAVYHELRRLAHHQMVDEAPGRTLQPTALVHEAYLRLFPNGKADFANRRHFFACAAKAMRRIRIDDARKRNSLRRGGGQKPRQFDNPSDSDVIGLDELPAVFDDDPAEVLAVNEAMEKLSAEHPRKAEIVTYRYFAGLSARETAEAMDLSTRTIDLDWRFAKAWLHRELS